MKNLGRYPKSKTISKIMEKAEEFKKKVIEKLKAEYDDADVLIEMIKDEDINFAVINGFSVDSYIYTLTF